MDACTDIYSAEIIKHQIHSFHQAVVIYFSYRIRGILYRYLRQHVHAILQSVEAIEDFNRDASITAGPLLWPVFIAASMALDEPLRARFMAVLDIIDSYGFEAASAGREIIYEMWQRWDTERTHYHWRSLLMERGLTLMLS